MKTSAFQKMENAAPFKRVASFTITHPKKPGGYAVVNAAYPADGAGRLQLFVIDSFGDTRTCQAGYASGYGYDKFAAALSGLTIDGHEMGDHCAQDATSKALLKKAQGLDYAAQRALLTKGKARGYQFANWGTNGPGSCYKITGLDYLRALGYVVILAL